jgi:hypothetical protein
MGDSDLGDLARSIGARVRRVRQATTSRSPSEPPPRMPEMKPVDGATRTFATRALDARPSDRSADASSARPDVATRRMNDDAGSWSSGHGPRARGRAVGKAVAPWALFAVVGVGAAIAWWPGTSSTSTLALPNATANPNPNATTNANPTESSNPTATSDSTSSAPPPGPPPERAAAKAGADPHETAAPLPAPSGSIASGHVRILANPQATVEIDGRARGSAPIGDLALAPGTHLVRLSCAPLGEAVSQNVRVEAGESVTISGDFTGAKGRILVRRAGPSP